MKYGTRIRHDSYPNGYIVGIGPAAPYGTICACDRPAVAECQGCFATLCTRCWWRHSHTSTSRYMDSTANKEQTP